MTANFYFAVDGLWVDATAIGASRDAEFEGRRIVLQLPESGGAFHPDVDIAWMQSVGEEGRQTSAEMIVLRVKVDLAYQVRAADYDFNLHGDLTEDISEAWDCGRRFVARFLEWVCVEIGQSQHAPSARVPPQPIGPVRILDSDGARIPLSWNPPWEISWRGDGPLMSTEILDTALDSVLHDVRPATSRKLLADAEFHAWHTHDTNAGIALVLAAVACEMAVKAHLRAASSPDQQELVELIIANPRDVSLAASSLFDKGMRAVHGRSMRELDMKLYVSVDLMFQHRNRFAHGRDLGVTRAELKTDLLAARNALGFLDSLETSPVEGRMRSAPTHLR